MCPEFKSQKTEVEFFVVEKAENGEETRTPLGKGFKEVEVNEKPEREIDIISAEFNTDGDWNSEIEYRVSADGKTLYINKTHFSLANIDEELRDELHDVCRRIVQDLTEKQGDK
ncbi:hypothetical protein P4284_16080 [Bacillus swezeyi]|uniref:hypothetical protein n=1 Tax=Bacillus swezeyi TaxID=1925020 RepID=UPI002E25038E|nr:hypothetical protein [Bacillus swezeyi]